MNRNEFFAALRSKISQLPESEIEKHIAYYDEMIADRMEDGMTEEEAVASLESVSVIAERILQDTSLPVLVKTKVRPKGGWTAAAIVLAIIGSPVWLPLLIAIAAVVFGLFVALWGIAIAVVCVVIAIVLAGLACLLMPIFMVNFNISSALLSVAVGLGIIGIALFAFVGVKYLVKGVAWLCRALGRGVKSMFIRKEN